jgi:hypothetical protein
VYGTTVDGIYPEDHEEDLSEEEKEKKEWVPIEHVRDERYGKGPRVEQSSEYDDIDDETEGYENEDDIGKHRTITNYELRIRNYKLGIEYTKEMFYSPVSSFFFLRIISISSCSTSSPKPLLLKGEGEFLPLSRRKRV